MTSIYECKPNQVKELLKVCLEIGEPVYISGEPGTGKTSLVGEVAQEEGYDYHPIIAAQTDALDCKGLVYKNDQNETDYAKPKMLPTGGRPLIFMDELPNAVPLVLNAWQQLIIPPHRLGDYTLPHGGRVVAAGNRVIDRAGAGKLTTAMGSRFTHIKWQPDAMDWVMGASRWGIDPIVLAFIQFRPNLFHKFDKNADTFPCARTWEKVSKFVKMNMKLELLILAVAGSVGELPVGEFIAFYSTYKKTAQSISGILLNPETYPIPDADKPSEMYAVCAALGYYLTPENFSSVMTYLDRIPSREYTVLAVKEACARDSKILTSPEYNNKFGLNPTYKKLIFS